MTSAQRPQSRERRWRRRTVRILVGYVSALGSACEYATTLGAGGLFIETAAPLPRGTPLRMRLRLPGTGDEHEIAGRVVWSHQPRRGEDQPSGMGIEFTDPVAVSRLARGLDALPD